MPANQAFLSVNAGELTPYLRHRTDFDKHGQGAELFENFLPLPFGGFRKRPGLEWIDDLPETTRLEPFQYSEASTYLLAIDTDGLTVYGSDGTIKDTVAYSFGDPFVLQFAHINSILWIVSPNFFPQLLTRVADTNWTISDAPFTFPPLLDENTDDDVELGLAASGSTPNWVDVTAYTVGQHVTAASTRQYTCIAAHTSAAAANEPGVGTSWATKWRVRYIPAGSTGLLSCAPGDAVFASAAAVGSVYRLRHERPLAEFESEIRLIAATTGQYSGTVVIQGGWTVASYGDWDGTVTLQLSFDGGTTWENRRTWTASKNRNFSTEGTEDRRCLARLLWTWDSLASINNPRAILTASSAFIESLVRIDSFTVPYTTATVTALTDAEIGTTSFWTESAFSPRRGYPAAIGVHAMRVLFGGTTDHPVGLWGSKSDDILNFDPDDSPGELASDSAFYRTLASTRQDPIRWIASKKRVIIGTAGGEWVAGNSGDDGFDTPDLVFQEHTFHGSAALPALRLNDGVFFVERQRRRIRELAYDLAREDYSAADLTRLAEHITAGQIVQLAWQGNREPALWAVTSTGLLLCFSYIREERIAAWSRHTTTGGLFRSVAVLRDEAGGDDVVWCVVERDGAFHLERFAAGQQAIQEAGTLAGCFHVDSGVRGAATDGSLQIDTPAHLDGTALQVLADGYRHVLTPAAGKLTLPYAAATVHAGLAISSRIILLPPDVQTQAGTSHAKIKRTNEIALSLYKSRGGQIIYPARSSDPRDIPTVDPDTPLDAVPPLVTGWYDVTLPGGHLPDLQFEVVHATPDPFTVTAMALEWTVTEQ